jgi:hypothetical protein
VAREKAVFESTVLTKKRTKVFEEIDTITKKVSYGMDNQVVVKKIRTHTSI